MDKLLADVAAYMKVSFTTQRFAPLSAAAEEAQISALSVQRETTGGGGSGGGGGRGGRGGHGGAASGPRKPKETDKCRKCESSGTGEMNAPTLDGTAP